MKRNKQPFVGRWALRRGEGKNICAGTTEGLESGRVAYVDWFGPTRVEPLTFHWRVEGEGETAKVCRRWEWVEVRRVGRIPRGRAYFPLIFFVSEIQSQ
jgi:hypothetical protein